MKLGLTSCALFLCAWLVEREARGDQDSEERVHRPIQFPQVNACAIFNTC